MAPMSSEFEVWLEALAGEFGGTLGAFIVLSLGMLFCILLIVLVGVTIFEAREARRGRRILAGKEHPPDRVTERIIHDLHDSTDVRYRDLADRLDRYHHLHGSH